MLWLLNGHHAPGGSSTLGGRVERHLARHGQAPDRVDVGLAVREPLLDRRADRTALADDRAGAFVKGRRAAGPGARSFPAVKNR